MPPASAPSASSSGRAEQLRRCPSRRSACAAPTAAAAPARGRPGRASARRRTRRSAGCPRRRVTSPSPHGPISDAGGEVADDRAEPEAARERHRDHGGGEVDEAAGQPGAVFHQAASIDAIASAAPLGGTVALRRSPRRDRSRASRDSRRAARANVSAWAASSASLALCAPCSMQRRQEAHAAQRRGLLVGRQEGVEEVAVVAVAGGTSPRGRRCSRPARGPCRAARCRRGRRPSRRSARRRARASAAAACRTSGSAAARRRAGPPAAPPARRRRRSGSRGRAA